MKRVQLVFPNANEAWNFLTLSKKQNVEVSDSTISGWFAESELELACNQFGADVQEYVIPVEPADTITATIEPTVAFTPGTGEAITLVGKSGASYNGTIYSKEDDLSALPAKAIICLTNSTFTNGTWQHAVNAIYQTNDVQQEMDRFQSRSDISHLIVLPVHEGEQSRVDRTDDLTRRYLHQ